MGFPINPPNTALVDQRGHVTPEWYRFFVAVQKMLGGPVSPFDDSALIAIMPLMPPSADATAEAILAAGPIAPVEQQDPLIPPAMPIPAWDDLMIPYRLAPGT